MLLGQLDDGTAPILNGGNEYKYDITVNLTSLNISGTIVAWTGGNTYTGNAEMQ